MSLKLSRLKKWLTLEDSAKYLSLLISEEVTTTDLLQLVLQGDLTISINLVNSYPAQIGPKVSIREAKLFRMPLLSKMVEGHSPEEIKGDEKLVFVDALSERVLKNYHSSRNATDGEAAIMKKFAANAAGESEAQFVVCFQGDLLPDYSGVLEFDRDTIHSITGIWDLSMEGSESLEIEDAFYGEIDGPGIDWVKLCGVILKHPSINRWANLVEHFKDGNDDITPHDYGPRGDLPEREPLVIRRDELQRFANSLNEPETAPVAGELEALPANFRALYESMGAGDLPHLEILIAAWVKFWRDRGPDDGKGRYPDNGEVAEWAKSRMDNPNQGNSKAKAIASIIRPTWAPAGRQPNRNQ